MPANSKIVITAVDKTKGGMTGVQKNVDAARKSVDRTAKSFIAMSSVALAGLGVLYTKSAQAGDQLAKTADKLGVTTEALSALQYAGELTGVSIQTTNMALQRMTRRLAEAAQGTGEAKGAIKELGLDAKTLAAQSPDQAFRTISEAMKGVDTQSDKVRLAMKLFDSEGVALVNTMTLGADGLDKMRAEADALGITLSRVDAAKMEAANDAMFKAGQVGTAFGNRITTELAPIVSGLAEEFLGVAKEAGGFGEMATEALDYVVKGVGLAANVVRGLQVAWDGVKFVVAGVTSTIVSGMAAADRAVTWLLNKLPGVKASTSIMLENLDSAFKSTYDGIHKDLKSSLMKPLPYDGVVKWAREAQRKANTAAEKVAAESGNRISSFNPATSTLGSTQADKDKNKTKLESLRQSLLSEENAEIESFLRRQDILNTAQQDKLISEERYNELSDQLATKHAEKLTSIEQEAQEKRLDAQRMSLSGAASMFGSMAEITAAFGDEQSATYKALFAISKAFAIAESIVKIQQGIAAAAALPFPSNIPAMASVAAATANIVTTIKGTELQGMAHDGMASIPQDGTWLLQKGERVLNTRQNKQFDELVKNGGGTGEVNITNVFQISPGNGSLESELKRLAPEIERLSERAVLKAISRGGRLAKAVGAR